MGHTPGGEVDENFPPMEPSPGGEVEFSNLPSPPWWGGSDTKIRQLPRIFPPMVGGKWIFRLFHGGEVEYRGGEVELVNFASPPWWGGRILDNFVLPPHGANPGGEVFETLPPHAMGGKCKP